jgi:hypothetical protein
MLRVIFVYLSVNESSEQNRDFTDHIVAPVVVEQRDCGPPMTRGRPNTPHVASSAIQGRGDG